MPSHWSSPGHGLSNRPITSPSPDRITAPEAPAPDLDLALALVMNLAVAQGLTIDHALVLTQALGPVLMLDLNLPLVLVLGILMDIGQPLFPVLVVVLCLIEVLYIYLMLWLDLVFGYSNITRNGLNLLPNPYYRPRPFNDFIDGLEISPKCIP